jgi:hypothetical protein
LGRGLPAHILEMLGDREEPAYRLSGQDRLPESLRDQMTAPGEDGRPGVRADGRQSDTHGTTVVGIPSDVDQAPPLEASDEATGGRKRHADAVADTPDTHAGRVVPDDEERTPLEQAELKPRHRLSERPGRDGDRGSRHELDRYRLDRSVIPHAGIVAQ